jgi:hypothetical protein
MAKVRSTVLAAAVLVSALGLSACSHQKRWCEFDATDTKVSNKFCENGTPGYEWEPDSDHKKKKTKKSTPKTRKTR